MSKSAPLLVFYGSQTGTAEAYGKMLGTYAASHGFEPVVCTMNDAVSFLSEGKAANAAAMIFVTSTYGTGEFPSNAGAFYKELTAGKLNSFLANIPYAILGLGNSKNEQYNAAAKKLDAALQTVGLKTILPMQLSCELQTNGHDAVFRTWKRSVWAALGCTSVGTLGSTYAVEPAAAAATGKLVPAGFVEAKVSSNLLLTPEGYAPASRLVALNISVADQQKMIGRAATCNEHVEVLPVAGPALVARALARLSLKPTDVFTIKPLAGAGVSYFDNATLTAETILKTIVDISSIPTRSLLEAFALVATTEEDKTKLQDLADDLSAHSEYDKLASGVFSVVDLLEMFPHLNINLAHLLTHVPVVKQRTYSVANHIAADAPSAEFQFCYTIPTRVAGSRTHEGLCTAMLSGLNPDDTVIARVVQGPATKPKNASTVLLIGLGSGIGTIRATLQMRQAAKNRGEAVGPAKLFYGFRNAGKNDVFRAELEAFAAQGLVTNVFVGSNDQAEFKTPMGEMDASLVEFLGDNGEMMYCGLGGSVPVVVEGHMRRVGLDVAAFRLGGRYHEEYFTPDLDMENLLKDTGAGESATTLTAKMGKCDMFCFQCEQTFKGRGCNKVGVCGKTPEVAALQDLTVHAAKILGFYLHELRANGAPEMDDLNRLTLYALFTTLTNVNFDATRFVKILGDMKAAVAKARVAYERMCKDKGITAVKKASITVPSADGDSSVGDIESLVDQGKNVGVLSRFVNPDTQSAAGVTEMLVYGLKGIAAYTDHSLMNNHENQEVYEFIHRALHLMSGDECFDLGKGLGMCLEAGKINVTSMGMLYNSNKTLGVPTITTVPNTPRPGKCILISGHDLIILKGLLEKTEPLGINVYTHGEMLPAHSYPELHKFKTLAGNYGGAWMRQSVEFPHFPGPVLMTTNCLTEPHESYAARIFTAGAVGWKGIPHIGNTMQDINFDSLIAAAQAAKGFGDSDMFFTYADPIGVKRPLNYTIGFGHETILSVAPTIVEEIQKGNITRFFLVGGCDGFEGQRSYYTELVSKLPKTAVVLTVGCGKYRLNHLDLGTIGDTGIPRILDMGQCNDSFGAVQVALALADVLKCEVKDLPLSIVLSWFEQKAIAVLLSCLHLGLKPIYVGPSLPAFITPDVLGVLVKDFGIRVCGDPEQDLQVMLAAKGMGWPE